MTNPRLSFFGQIGVLFLLALAVGSKNSCRAGTVVLEVATNGTLCGPLYSFQGALAQSREIHSHHGDTVHLKLHGGTYELESTLELTERDSGLAIEPFFHDMPVISGGHVIHDWKRSSQNPSIWEAPVSSFSNSNQGFHELFFNGQRRARTRLPESGFFHTSGISKEHSTQLLFDSQSNHIHVGWTNGGDTEVVVYQAWAEARNLVHTISSNSISLAGEALPNSSEVKCRFFIENAPVKLRPGQWRLDRSKGIVSYNPDAGESVQTGKITVPHLYDLIQIKGTADHPAHDITFRGIIFADTDWALPNGTDTDPQAAVEVPGAMQLRFASHCTFNCCTFCRMGGYALDFNRGCTSNAITRNEITDVGAGGIRMGETGLNGAIEFPTGNNLISDNHIHHIGVVNAPGVGIFVLMSSGNRIAHNEVDHTFYTAISLGWSWGYGPAACSNNMVEFNHLHDIGQGVLSDMGGIYTLGLEPGTILRNNLIHDVNISVYGGWGLYTDEGSTGICLESNVVYHCQSAGFHQHYGMTNLVRNNIFAFNKDFEMMRTRVEKGLALTITNNIVYFDTGKLIGGRWGDDLVMDRNFYFYTNPHRGPQVLTEQLAEWRKRGHDVHSLVVDPLFVNPDGKNFRLLPWSPALRRGFGQIDLSSVGVRAWYAR